MHDNIIKIAITFGLAVLITGCYSSKIADDFITARNQAGVENPKSNQLQKVLGTYFVIGGDIKKALNKLDSQGFRVTEYSIEGHRDYPDGDLNPYIFHPTFALERKMRFKGNHLYEYSAIITVEHNIFIDEILVIGMYSNIDGSKIQKVTAFFSD